MTEPCPNCIRLQKILDRCGIESQKNIISKWDTKHHICKCNGFAMPHKENPFCVKQELSDLKECLKNSNILIAEGADEAQKIIQKLKKEIERLKEYEWKYKELEK